MAVLAYDDVMLREPRLLVPQQAPIGAVRLDPTHRWRKHVVWATVPGNTTELVSGRSLTISGVTVGGYQGNKCWAFNGSSYISDTFVDATRPFTFFAIAACTNTTATNEAMAFGTSSGSGYIALNFSGTEANDPLRAIAYGTAGFSCYKTGVRYNELLPVWGEYQQIGGDEYADPYQWRTALTTASTDRVGSWPTPTEISVGSSLVGGGRSNYFNGYIALALVLRDAIGIGAALADDPWQLFIPA